MQTRTLKRKSKRYLFTNILLLLFNIIYQFSLWLRWKLWVLVLFIKLCMVCLTWSVQTLQLIILSNRIANHRYVHQPTVHLLLSIYVPDWFTIFKTSGQAPGPTLSRGEGVIFSMGDIFWEGCGTFPQNSFKPSLDLWEVTL